MDKLERFRLVAEMTDGKVFAVNLTDEQHEEFHKALEHILEGKLSIHYKPFGEIMDMVPTELTDRNGKQIKDGDTLEASFGIPPIKTQAKVYDYFGELWVSTPRQTPKRCKLNKFIKNVGEVEIVEKG